MMISFTCPPDEGLFNSMMLEAKSLLHGVFEMLVTSPSSISIVYTNDLCKDTLVLMDLIKKRREEMLLKFPRINDLTLIELEHLLSIRNERALNFNSNVEDVVLISIILRRLTEVFLPPPKDYRVEFRRIEMNAIKKVSFVRNKELKEAESFLGMKEMKKRKERKKEQLCKGFPSGSLCLNMAVGKPEGKQRFVSLCKKCMTNRQTYIAKLRVTKERKIEEKEEHVQEKEENVQEKEENVQENKLEDNGDFPKEGEFK